MKNAKKIKNNTISLFLALTMILGTTSYAIPGIMPSASAATENLFVSADNTLFDKSFNGPMVVEIVVNGNDIDETDDPEPDVTINGNNIKMVQGADGSWYAYIADNNILTDDVRNSISYGDKVLPFDVGIASESDADAVYKKADLVIRQPKSLSINELNVNVLDTDDDATDEWPIIQAYDFTPDGDVVITYTKGGNTQVITLTYLNDASHLANFDLDRSYYPPGADVHMTITSLSHNIDPTDEDSWTYNTLNGDAYYQIFDERGANERNSNTTVVTLVGQHFNFVDEAQLLIDIAPNNEDTPILLFRDNDDQITNNDDNGIANDNEIVLLHRNGTLVVITQPVTILETLPSSGIFKNTDNNDKSNVYVNPDANRGLTAEIDFPNTGNSLIVRNNVGSVLMDIASIGGTWRAGEELAVVIDDGDFNLNSLIDEDMALDTRLLPAIVIGSPLTIQDANLTGVTLFDANTDTVDADDFAKRGHVENTTVIVTFSGDKINNYAANVIDDDLYYIIHFDSSNDAITSFAATYYQSAIDNLTAIVGTTNFADISAAIDTRTGANLAYQAVQNTNNQVSIMSMALSAASVLTETANAISTAEPTTISVILSTLETVILPSTSVTTQENIDGVISVVTAIAASNGTVAEALQAATDETSAIGALTVTITGNTYTDIIVVDIFRFGQQVDNLESAATTRYADAIYRIVLEESGDNTAMYIGTIEYVLLNQLNVGEIDTYTSLVTIDDEITVIVTTDSTDEDAIRIDYLDIDSEGIITQIGDQVDAPTHSGVVSFDAANYKVADTVTVTLTDADLNTNSDTTEVYTSTTDLRGDRVGGNSDGSNYQIGRLVDITFDDATWSLMGCGISGNNGLASTGFVLTETSKISGIFTGTFQIPANYCTSETTNSTSTGKDLEVNYVDYSDASGELIEVGDSAGIRASTGSVSFDRTVYPVPFDASLYTTQHNSQSLADADSSISGNTVLHVRVNDPDYDTAGSGSDTLPADTIEVKIHRGSLKSNDLATDTTPIKEISQSTGIFELDLALGATFTCDNTAGLPLTDDRRCTFIDTNFSEEIQIKQGDIITVQYTDATDASGSKNTVTDSATFDLRNAVLQTDETTYIVGSDMILTLIEPDFDLDSDETESYPLNLIEWDSDAGILALGESLNFDPEPSVLRETGDSTGIFQVVIEVPSKLGTNTLERGEQIDLEYVDYGPAGADYVGTDDEDIELTIFTSNFGATISLDQKVYTWTDKVYITITAPDHNFDSDLIDQIGDPEDDNPIKVSTRENRINYYRLVETGTDTGIFTGEVILTGFEHDADGKRGFDAPTQPTTSYDTRTNPAGPTDGYLEAEDDDGITVSFEVSDDETVIGSAIIRWNIGEIEWAEASYSASGNGLVRITDPDLNLNPESVDNFDVDVWSDSDPGGISLTVTETNEATGVFEGQVSFTTTDESSGHRLRVAEGDTITVEYEDHTLPDPYDTSDDLDILSTAIIGSIVAPLERAPVSNARIVDTQGQTLSSVSVDQQVLVSADLRSGQDKDQDYAYLVQIQDADGVTVSLSWITSTLTAGSASSPSQSWTPTVGGDYTATVFVWESITNPTALSASDTVTIQVS